MNDGFTLPPYSYLIVNVCKKKFYSIFFFFYLSVQFLLKFWRDSFKVNQSYKPLLGDTKNLDTRLCYKKK